MPVGRRARQVGDLLQAELATLIQHNVRDPRVGFVTVTEVSLSPDLKSARIYISVMGQESREVEALEALTGAAGFLRRELASRTKLKQVPQLSFLPDRTLNRGDRIDRILEEIGGEE